RSLQHRVDHAGQTARQSFRIVAAAEPTVAGGGGEADELAVHARAARERALGLLEDEETAPLAGNETGPSVVGGDHAPRPVRREEQLLELVVGAAAEGDVEIAFVDEPRGVAYRARTADVALGDRAAEPLSVV